MSVPVVEKTWQFAVNIACGNKSSTTLEAADYTLKAKDALKGFPSGQWSVKASSDGTTADLNDNWTDHSTLLWAADGANHAWIVLANSATGMEICFDFNNTDARYPELIISHAAGFDVSSPSLTNRPTATDQTSYTSADTYAAFYTGWVGRLHVMMDTDGECTRIMQCIGNNLTGLILLETAKDPIAAWTSTQVFCYAYGNSAGIDMYSTAYNVVTYSKVRFNGSFFQAYLTSEGYDYHPLGEQMTAPDALTGEWLMSPVGIASDYGGRQGRKGALYDLWFGPQALPNTGDTFPADGSMRFAQFGFMIFPWNGTVPLVY